MSEIATFLLLGYALITVCVLAIAAVGATEDPSWRTRRTAARVALLCWAWPVLLLWQLGRGLKYLWEEADWRRS